jgi:hypothetical protein
MKTLCLIVLLLSLLASAVAQPFTLLDLAFLSSSRTATVIPEITTNGLGFRLSQFSERTNVNGGAVSRWLDFNGSGQFWTNGGGAATRFWTNSVLGTNGAVRFISEGLTNFNGVLNAGTNIEFFAVLRSLYDSGGIPNTIPWYLPTVGAVGDAAHPFSEGLLYENIGLSNSFTGLAVSNSWRRFTDWHTYNVSVQTNLLTIRWNGELIFYSDRMNGGLRRISNPTFTNRVNVASIASGNSWNGEMAEMFAYTNVPSLTAKQQIFQVLSNTYTIGFTNLADVYRPNAFSNLYGWYQSSGLTNFNGSAISNWLDSSGLGNHITNSIANERPTMRTAAVNGLNVAEFGWSRSNLLAFAADVSSSDFTVLAIAAPMTNNSTIISDTGGASGSQLRVFENSTNAIQFFTAGAGAISPGIPTYTTTNYQMWVISRRGTVVTEYLNSVSTNGSIGGTFVSRLWGGGSAKSVGFVGPIAELAIWTNNALSVADISKLYGTYYKTNFSIAP